MSTQPDRRSTHASRIAKAGALATAILGGAAWAFGGASPEASGADVDATTPQPLDGPAAADPREPSTTEPGRQETSPITDPELAMLVVKRLRWDTHIDETRVDVRVDDARVSLSGSVGSEHERRRAIASAWVAGVQEVDGDALFVQARPRALAPERIERAIANALAVDPALKGADVHVTVRSSVAVLRGRVDDLAASLAAETIAETAPGVAVVSNEIAITRWADDEAIAADVTAALASAPETAHLGVQAQCADGIVAIDGEVDTFAQRRAVEDVSARIHGVQAIDDRLRVRAPEVAFHYDPHPAFRPSGEPLPRRADRARRDEDIAAAIRAELQWSRVAAGVRIDVSVRRGTATLTGDVQTAAVHDAAVWNAYQGGATAIVDRLFVAERAGQATGPQSDPGDVIFGRD